MSEVHSGTSKVRETVIENWMRMVVATGGIERFDDLHIDRIDPARRDRGFWLKGCSDAIDLAKELKKIIAPDKSLAMMCALISEEDELAPPRMPAELLEQIDWSPPSLYLFDPESEPWADSGTVILTPVDRIFPACSRWFTMEFNAPQQDELRWTFVAVLLKTSRKVGVFGNQDVWAVRRGRSCGEPRFQRTSMSRRSDNFR